LGEPYLQRLTGQLIDGVDRLPIDFRHHHAAWIRARQNADGGFSGREGGSDLYYTGFALRALTVLQGLEPETCDRAANFLRTRLAGSADVIDLFSLLVSVFLVRLGGGPDILAAAPADWPDRVADSLEAYRHADGGYSRARGGTAGSTYTTFLVLLATQVLDRPPREPERLLAFLRGRFRDGGFVEIAQMKRPGTNPTAAGIGCLQILGGLDEATRLRTIDFLLSMRAEGEKALRANDRIPAADLLSTFTGSWTLADLGGLAQLDQAGLREYAEGLQGRDGGFRGGAWDVGYDVEYTFYGVGLLGLLAE
jgi:geranylgeranyl transferase type-2 subunit beta